MKVLLLLLAYAVSVQAACLSSRAVPKDTVVIIRTHRPSDGMKERILRVAEDVMSQLPTAHMVVSVDGTGPWWNQWKVPLPEANVHHLTWHDVTRHFSAVPWGKLKPRANGHTTHDEPIILAFEYAKNVTKVASNAMVWVLEDDVLVCGNLSTIVQSYKKDDSDLLSSGTGSAARWPFRDRCSPAYCERYPVEKRRVSTEFVRRYSSRLLDHIHKLSRDEGVSGMSEMFAPTVCNVDGFKHGRFNRSDLGTAKTWRYNSRISNTSMAGLCGDSPNTLHHAAKFVRLGAELELELE